MSRSSWKGIFIENSLNDLELNKNVLYSYNLRNSSIISKFIGLKFDVYNGNQFTSVIITSDMVGHKFGEFAFSTKAGKSKKIGRIKKKIVIKKKKVKMKLNIRNKRAR